MASSSMCVFFHCHYAFQNFPFFCVTLCVLHALQNATLSHSADHLINNKLIPNSAHGKRESIYVTLQNVLEKTQRGNGQTEGISSRQNGDSPRYQNTLKFTQGHAHNRLFTSGWSTVALSAHYNPCAYAGGNFELLKRKMATHPRKHGDPFWVMTHTHKEPLY